MYRGEDTIFRPICRVLAVAAALIGTSAAAAEVRVGFANPLSGPFAASGERNRQGARLAVAMLNETGGVLGHEVRLVAVDDACGTEQATAAALQLVEADVAVVVGHFCSHSSLLAAPIYEAVGLPMITPDSTHPRLTEVGRPNVFRLTGRDDEQGRIAGDWLARRRPGQRIGIVHDGSTYGMGLAEHARAQLHRRGVREALFEEYTPGAASYGGLVRRLTAAGASLLYVGGYGPDAGLIARTARAQGSTLRLVGGDGLGMEEFWTVAADAGDGTLFTARPDVRAQPAAEQVLEEFRTLGLGPSPSGLAAYAAVQVWAEAARRAQSLDPVTVTRMIHRGRFATVLGRVAFADNGDLLGTGWQWQEWHDGAFAPMPITVTTQ